MENFNELENMRMQMSVLKSRLDNQVIINERILRRAVKGSTSWIRRRYILCMIVAVAMVPYFLIVMQAIGFSFVFTVVSCAFMLIAAGYTYRNMRALNRNFLSEANLVEAGRDIAHARKMDADWLKFSIPTVVVWLFWFFYEGCMMCDNVYFVLGGVIGGVLGGVVGFTTHMKIQRKYREVISQIDDLTA